MRHLQGARNMLVGFLTMLLLTTGGLVVSPSLFTPSFGRHCVHQDGSGGPSRHGQRSRSRV